MLRTELTGSKEATLNAAARCATGFYAKLEMHDEICDIYAAQRVAAENFLKTLQTVCESHVAEILAAAETVTRLSANERGFWTEVRDLNAVKIYRLFDGLEEQDHDQGATGQPDSAFFAQLEAHLHINIKGVRKVIVDTLQEYVDEREALRTVPISVIIEKKLKYCPNCGRSSLVVVTGGQWNCPKCQFTY